MLTTFASNDLFSGAIIKYDAPSSWSVEFQSANSNMKFPLTLARGGLRCFKTPNAAFSCALEIFNSSTANVTIVR